jgi:hypothetical protein
MILPPVSCNLKGGMKYFVPPQGMAPMASGMIGALSNGMDLMNHMLLKFKFFLSSPTLQLIQIIKE